MSIEQETSGLDLDLIVSRIRTVLAQEKNFISLH